MLLNLPADILNMIITSYLTNLYRIGLLFSCRKIRDFIKNRKIQLGSLSTTCLAVAHQPCIEYYTSGNINMTRWIISHTKDALCISNYIGSNNDIPLLIWCIENGYNSNIDFDSCVISGATMENSIDIFKKVATKAWMQNSFTRSLSVIDVLHNIIVWRRRLFINHLIDIGGHFHVITASNKFRHANTVRQCLTCGHGKVFSPPVANNKLGFCIGYIFREKSVRCDYECTVTEFLRLPPLW